VDEIKRGSFTGYGQSGLVAMGLVLVSCLKRQLQGIDVPEAKLDSQIKMCFCYDVWSFGIDLGVNF
jgi:hypothetical protein